MDYFIEKLYNIHMSPEQEKRFESDYRPPKWKREYLYSLFSEEEKEAEGLENISDLEVLGRIVAREHELQQRFPVTTIVSFLLRGKQERGVINKYYHDGSAGSNLGNLHFVLLREDERTANFHITHLVGAMAEDQDELPEDIQQKYRELAERTMAVEQLEQRVQEAVVKILLQSNADVGGLLATVTKAVMNTLKQRKASLAEVTDEQIHNAIKEKGTAKRKPGKAPLFEYKEAFPEGTS